MELVQPDTIKKRAKNSKIGVKPNRKRELCTPVPNCHRQVLRMIVLVIFIEGPVGAKSVAAYKH